MTGCSSIHDINIELLEQLKWQLWMNIFHLQRLPLYPLNCQFISLSIQVNNLIFASIQILPPIFIFDCPGKSKYFTNRCFCVNNLTGNSIYDKRSIYCRLDFDLNSNFDIKDAINRDAIHSPNVCAWTNSQNYSVWKCLIRLNLQW